MLEIALRDILREDLGQTYTVSVGLSQPLPQRGAGHIEVQLRRRAGEHRDDDRARDAGNQAAAAGRAVRDLTNRAKESARRGYETALKQNDYWLRRLQTIHTLGGDPGEILTRAERIDAVTPQVLQDVFKKYLPLDRYTVVTLVPAPARP